jgi:photosystem II stability/assembly factor-like uncharacterized protein
MGSLADIAGRVWCLAVTSGDPNVVYAATSAALFQSEDGGLTWAPLSGAGLGVEQVAVAPADPQTIYVTSYAGDGGLVLRSSDGGATWTSVTPAGWNDIADTLAVDPLEPQTVYLGGIGFYASHDGGTTWTASMVVPDNPALGVAQIVADTKRPATVYALTGVEGQILRLIYRSDDGGATWMQHSLEETVAAIGMGASGTLYAIGQVGEVASSLHGRRPWHQLSSLGSVIDPAFPVGEDLPLTAFAVDPGSEALVVAISTTGLLRATGASCFRPSPAWARSP